uniref:Uncharacterized protein n=1 Tax=Glossina pallidipes TaxID=7398 RepID=A0A1A9ZR55_GLOPL
MFLKVFHGLGQCLASTAKSSSGGATPYHIASIVSLSFAFLSKLNSTPLPLVILSPKRLTNLVATMLIGDSALTIARQSTFCKLDAFNVIVVVLNSKYRPLDDQHDWLESTLERLLMNALPILMALNQDKNYAVILQLLRKIHEKLVSPLKSAITLKIIKYGFHVKVEITLNSPNLDYIEYIMPSNLRDESDWQTGSTANNPLPTTCRNIHNCCDFEYTEILTAPYRIVIEAKRVGQFQHYQTVGSRNMD